MNISYAPPTAFSVGGSATLRPNYLGGSLYTPDRSPNRFFNPAAVIAPSTQTPNDPSRPFGNLGRNVARTNGIFNLN